MTRTIIDLVNTPTEQRDHRWIRESLEAALQLEMSTIPPYLYALWSIPIGERFGECGLAILEIVEEEMLHMAIAANLLAAIGEQPDFIEAAPSFPTHLPMRIHEHLQVDLAPLSPDLVLKTFMVIEEPVTPLVDDPCFQPPAGDRLIGQFYEDLRTALANSELTFSRDGQVDLRPANIHPNKPFIITSATDARDAIHLITQQGEGTPAGAGEQSSPFENDPTEPAHFYRFGGIYHGQALKQLPDGTFSYSGELVTMPTIPAVWPVTPGPAGLAFDQQYSDLLRSLQAMWHDKGAIDIEKAFKAVENAMKELTTTANTMFGAGPGPHGPAFRLVDKDGHPIPRPQSRLA